ncbi:MAG TPA: hypothetical protein VF034_14095, partial [Gemmatimonadaceae bacterium]
MRTRRSALAAERRQRNGWGEHASALERLLHLLGADAAFVDAVLGDLAEERAERTITDGARSARRWYVSEALRSLPHLVASAFRGASGRRRVMTTLCLAAIALAMTLAVRSILNAMAPAQLIATAATSDGIVINNGFPVQLSMRVLNARGKALPDSGVRYRWLSGAPIPVSPRGVAACNRSGDAVVRASLGRLATQLVLRCRPVHDLRTMGAVNLVLGDPGVKVTFQALDEQGHEVSLLRGEISVEDSTVATLDVAADGTRIVRPRAPGTTFLGIHIGDQRRGAIIHVFERTTSVEGIRKGQYLAVPVELAGGEVRQWQLPGGPEAYSLTVLPDGDGDRLPRLAIVGANCVTSLGPG